MVPAGETGYVGYISNGSAYGYSCAYDNYFNKAVTGTTDATTDYKSDSSSFMCAVTVNTENTKKGEITGTSGGSTSTTDYTGSGLRELHIKATDTASDYEATRIYDMAAVTNTMN